MTENAQKIIDLSNGYNLVPSTVEGSFDICRGDQCVIVSPEWSRDEILASMEDGLGLVESSVRRTVLGLMRSMGTGGSIEGERSKVIEVEEVPAVLRPIGVVPTWEHEESESAVMGRVERAPFNDVAADEERSRADLAQMVANYKLLTGIIRETPDLFTDCTTAQEKMARAMQIMKNASGIGVVSEADDSRRRRQHTIQSMGDRVSASPLARGLMPKSVREAADTVALAVGEMTAAEAVSDLTKEDVERLTVLRGTKNKEVHDRRALAIQLEKERKQADLAVRNEEADASAKRRREASEATIEHLGDFGEGLVEFVIGQRGIAGKLNDIVLGQDGILQRSFTLFKSNSFTSLVGDLAPGVICGTAFGFAGVEMGWITAVDAKSAVLIWAGVGAVASYGLIGAIKNRKKKSNP